ncbi:hypothetical protein [Candidatus Regiella insecticola]|nr:hypothetical protein [Candidatus Regiella insecticola]
MKAMARSQHRGGFKGEGYKRNRLPLDLFRNCSSLCEAKAQGAQHLLT